MNESERVVHIWMRWSASRSGLDWRKDSVVEPSAGSVQGVRGRRIAPDRIEHQYMQMNVQVGG